VTIGRIPIGAASSLSLPANRALQADVPDGFQFCRLQLSPRTDGAMGVQPPARGSGYAFISTSQPHTHGLFSQGDSAHTRSTSSRGN